MSTVKPHTDLEDEIRQDLARKSVEFHVDFSERAWALAGGTPPPDLVSRAVEIALVRAFVSRVNERLGLDAAKGLKADPLGAARAEIESMERRALPGDISFS